MPTRRALLATLGVGLAGCGTTRREMDPGTAAPPPMDFEPGTPDTPSPRSSPLSIDESFRWPAPFYDAANSVQVPTSGPVTDPTVEWEVWLPDGTDADHALIDGRWLYALGGGRLAVVDRRDGQLVRSESLSVVPETAPTLTDEAFVVGTRNDDLDPAIALVGTTGERLWERDGGSLGIPPAVDGGTIYVLEAGELVARDRSDGSVAWRARAHEGDEFVTYPAVADGTVYVCGVRGSTYAVDAETSDREWRRAAGGEGYPQVVPTVGEQLVFGGFGEGASNLAFDRGSGERAWRTDEPVPIGTHAVAGDLVVAVSGTGRVVALSRQEGDVAWTEPGGAGRPIVAGETVYLRGEREGDEGERIVALSLGDGTRRWERRIDGAGWLLVADGYCYLNRGDGVIQCIG